GLAGYAVLKLRPIESSYPLAQAYYLLILFCSGPFWTLVAGSTIGGAMFAPAVFALVELTSSFVVSRITDAEIDPFSAHPALVVVRIVYTLSMVWLGWRKYTSYELKSAGE